MMNILTDFIKVYKNWKLSKANKELLEDIAFYVRDWDRAVYQQKLIDMVEKDKVAEWWVKAHKILNRPYKELEEGRE